MNLNHENAQKIKAQSSYRELVAEKGRRKMNEQEKRTLNFYHINSILWKADDPDHNSKTKFYRNPRENVSLSRTCMSREIKKELRMKY